MFKALDGWKTYLASAGLFGLALYHFSVGDFSNGLETIMAALAVFGVRNAMARSGM